MIAAASNVVRSNDRKVKPEIVVFIGELLGPANKSETACEAFTNIEYSIFSSNVKDKIFTGGRLKSPSQDWTLYRDVAMSSASTAIVVTAR